MQAEHWHWKYHQGPRLGTFNLIARAYDGRILGHVGASVFLGQVDGQALPMAQVTDVMVHPEARSAYGHEQGIYPQLMKRLQRELSDSFPGVFAYGFVGIRPYKLGERLGLYQSRQACRTGQIALPSHAANLFNAYLHAYPQTWRQALDRGLFDKTSRECKRHHLRPRLERNTDYMQWRYANHPQHIYQLWEVRQWGQEQGWVITRQLGPKEHMVVDQWPEPEEQAADAMTLRHMAAVLGQIHQDSDSTSVLSSWHLDTPKARQTEPIIATEMRVDAWRTNLKSPIFNPGDTDVF